MKTVNNYPVPAAPEREPSPLAMDALAVAKTYLAHAQQLVYSHGAKTFLWGYELFDPKSGCGLIDCTTFLLLALTGIPYEDSPYSTGTVESISSRLPLWAETELMDFTRLPLYFVSIKNSRQTPFTTRRRRRKPKKGNVSGSTKETLSENASVGIIVRYPAHIARYCLEKGVCFSDPSFRKAGDLAFFQSPDVVILGKQRFSTGSVVIRAGLVSEDPAWMITCFGKNHGQAGEDVPAVSLSPVFGPRAPDFFARPPYGNKEMAGMAQVTGP